MGRQKHRRTMVSLRTSLWCASDEKEIQAAFDVLDIDKNGFISLNNLKKRLGVFFPDMTAEYRFLMNNQKETPSMTCTSFCQQYHHALRPGG